MIDESWYWKVDLMKRAKYLRSKSTQKRWPEASLARCEQNVMFGFFAVRKLIESRKLTEKVSRMSLQVQNYPPKGRKIHHFNVHRIDDLYDLTRPKAGRVGLPFLCNQVVHSYVFSWTFEEPLTLSGVLVSSDRERSKRLLQISIAAIIRTFEAIGSDDAVGLTARFDDKKGDYVLHLR
jgi:hypothetical protein